MADVFGLLDMATTALRAAEAKLRAVGDLLGQRAVLLARVAARQTLRAAGATNHRAKEACASIRLRASVAALRYAKVLPSLHSCRDAAHSGLEDLRSSLTMRLRPLEDPTSCADQVSRLSEQLEAFWSEVRLMPMPAVAVASLLALRLVVALNSIGDALIDELLHGHTAFSRCCLMTAVAPGLLAICQNRDALLQELPTAVVHVSPRLSSVGTDPASDSSPRVPPQAAVLLARNLRCMPPAFWLAICPSMAVSLQVMKWLSLRTIRGVLHARLRWLLCAAIACAIATGRGRERAIMPAAGLSEALPPGVSKALCTIWYRLQALTRSGCKQIAALSAAVGAASMPPQTRNPSVCPPRLDPNCAADVSKVWATIAASATLLAHSNSGPVFRGLGQQSSKPTPVQHRTEWT